MPSSSEHLMSDSDVDLLDISWLMDGIDLEAVLDRLAINVEFRRGPWLWAYCPDHFQYVGKEPSHPKWSVNEETGMCKCFTEPRVSNLVFTIARLKNISPIKAAEWILGYDVHSIEAKCSRIKKMLSPHAINKRIDAFDIDQYKKYIEDGVLGSSSVALLAKNNIHPDTAKNFGCVEFQDGHYHDRMIFPVKDFNRQLKGFIATATQSCEEWLKQNPTIIDRKYKRKRSTKKDDYRKVLYPSNFKISHFLIGENQFKIGDIAILVEGCRDVLKLRQEGFSGSLGIGGTSLSDEQLLTLSKLSPKKLMIMLDGDEGGRNGAKRIVEKCLSLFGEIFVINLTGGKDPKDLSREEILQHMRRHTERISLNMKNSLL